jgi:hypothetical protein
MKASVSQENHEKAPSQQNNDFIEKGFKEPNRATKRLFPALFGFRLNGFRF